jgi:hypothetical protein
MIHQAYKVVITAHCATVVANDLSDLRSKTLVFPDMAKFDFDVKERGRDFFETLIRIISDEHYETVPVDPTTLPTNGRDGFVEARKRMDRLIAKYRAGFVFPGEGPDRVFGGIALRIPGTDYFLVTPREKGKMFTAADAVIVCGIGGRDRPHIYTYNGGVRKASLNAPLLIRHLQKFGNKGSAVLHQHEQLSLVPTEAYAPPGTVRDNDRNITAITYNIEGHGFVSLLDDEDRQILG